MTVAIGLTESDVFTTLRTALLSWLPGNTPVIKAQQNRVPEPIESDFVVMLPVFRRRLSTNLVTYSDGFDLSLPSTRTDTQETEITIQLDVHGPHSADNSTVVSTLFRSGVACEAFAATGLPIAPLYSTDPRQLVFVNSEDQFEDRWTFDVVLQANIDVTTPQQFAAEVDVNTSGIIAQP